MKNESRRRIVMAGLGSTLMALTILAPSVGRQRRSNASLAWGQQPSVPAAHDASAEAVIDVWPDEGKKTARVMILKYGEPDRVDADSLTWDNNGPWKKTVVHRDATYDVAGGSKPIGVLEQTITYHLPEGRFASLDDSTRNLVGDPGRDELTFRSNSEKENYLAINLANEIVNRDKTPEEAHAFYAKQISLMGAGKSSRYLNGFLFPVDNENAKRQ